MGDLPRNNSWKRDFGDLVDSQFRSFWNLLYAVNCCAVLSVHRFLQLELGAIPTISRLNFSITAPTKTCAVHSTAQLQGRRSEVSQSPPRHQDDAPGAGAPAARELWWRYICQGRASQLVSLLVASSIL